MPSVQYTNGKLQLDAQGVYTHANRHISTPQLLSITPLLVGVRYLLKADLPTRSVSRFSIHG